MSITDSYTYFQHKNEQKSKQNKVECIMGRVCYYVINRDSDDGDAEIV